MRCCITSSSHYLRGYCFKKLLLHFKPIKSEIWLHFDNLLHYPTVITLSIVTWMLISMGSTEIKIQTGKKVLKCIKTENETLSAQKLTAIVLSERRHSTAKSPCSASVIWYCNKFSCCTIC